MRIMAPEKARVWRRAILERARQKEISPEEVLNDFWPYMLHNRPNSITKEEAKKLAKDFSQDEGEIFKLFSRDPAA